MLITILIAIAAIVVGYKLGISDSKRQERINQRAMLLSIRELKIARPHLGMLHAEQRFAWEIGRTLGHNRVEWLGTVISLYGDSSPIFRPDAEPFMATVDRDTPTGDWTFQPEPWLLPYYEEWASQQQKVHMP